MWSSWRVSSAAIALAISGSKLAIVIFLLNIVGPRDAYLLIVAEVMARTRASSAGVFVTRAGQSRIIRGNFPSRLSMAQFIFTMNRVGKVVPPKRIILRDISLSFFPGAKIGVLGLNGSGKSTLLKIMSGVDKDIEGEARAQAGIKVGY